MQTLRSIFMGVLVVLLLSPLSAQAQSRGVYPLGMSSTNSGHHSRTRFQLLQPVALLLP